MVTFILAWDVSNTISSRTYLLKSCRTRSLNMQIVFSCKLSKIYRGVLNYVQCLICIWACTNTMNRWSHREFDPNEHTRNHVSNQRKDATSCKVSHFAHNRYFCAPSIVFTRRNLFSAMRRYRNRRNYFDNYYNSTNILTLKILCRSILCPESSSHITSNDTNSIFLERNWKNKISIENRHQIL